MTFPVKEPYTATVRGPLGKTAWPLLGMSSKDQPEVDNLHRYIGPLPEPERSIELH